MRVWLLISFLYGFAGVTVLYQRTESLFCDQGKGRDSLTGSDVWRMRKTTKFNAQAVYEHQGRIQGVALVARKTVGFSDQSSYS